MAGTGQEKGKKGKLAVQGDSCKTKGPKRTANKRREGNKNTFGPGKGVNVLPLRFLRRGGKKSVWEK